MPQQSNPSRQTVMERIVNQLNHDQLTWTEAAERVRSVPLNASAQEVLDRLGTEGES